MKWIVVLALAISVSACSVSHYFGTKAPQPVSGDENRFVIYDQSGVTQKEANSAAQKFCAYYARTAELVSRGGDAPECGGRQSDLCATYTCK